MAMAKLILTLAACVLIVAAALEAGPAYTTKYDNIDIDEIMKNDRLFSSYFDCIMDKPDAKCTPEGSELKKLLPDAIKTACGGCSEKQKEGARKVIKYMHEHKKEEWLELLNKYDPDGSIREKYKNEANSLLGTSA